MANTVNFAIKGGLTVGSKQVIAANSAIYANSVYDNGIELLTFANSINTYAYSAYSSANSTLTYATAAFNLANTGNVLAQAAYNQANLANVLAQSSYDYGNTVNTYAFSAYSYANGTNTLTVSAYNKANAANVLAQASFDFANTVNAYSSSAYAFANSVNTYAFAAYANGNNTLQYSQSAYAFANAVNTYAYSAYANGNNTLQFAQAGFNLANTSNVTAQAAFNKANASVQTGFTTISANGTSITPSSNNDTLTLTAATSNGINILNPSSKTIDFGLKTSGVTAGSYGNTSTIPSITIDAYGRITSVSNTAVSVAGSNIITNVDKFTGTGSQTSFALSATPFNINNTLINIDGVTQQKSTYSVSGNNIVFSTPPLTGNSIEVSYSYNLPPSNLTGVVTNVDTFISNGSTTVFTLSSTPVSSNNVTVNINGAVQQKSTYSVSGVSIILTESPASGAKIEVSYFYNTTIAFVSSTPTLNSLSLAYSTQVNTIAYANTAGINNLIDTFSTYAFRTAMYDVQVTNGSGYQSSKLMVVQSDSDAIVSEYSTVSTYLSSLGSFTANVVFNATLNTNVAQLYFNPNYSGNSTVIINRTTIANTGISSTLTLGQTYDLNTISLSTIDLNTYVNEPIDLAF